MKDEPLEKSHIACSLYSIFPLFRIYRFASPVLCIVRNPVSPFAWWWFPIHWQPLVFGRLPLLSLVDCYMRSISSACHPKKSDSHGFYIFIEFPYHAVRPQIPVPGRSGARPSNSSGKFDRSFQESGNNIIPKGNTSRDSVMIISSIWHMSSFG